ncbi:2-dehydropantoate 2-reductase [Pseudonocardia acaciae]|uniref:2-dehydropantoate 2-reductase n=1 Tax=Pseudonocardia acaciae TaxID=551276 RepID=UPI00048ADE74|nr:2-dehydropantoate 2-reductase [Pseudonocardia acaciae]
MSEIAVIGAGGIGTVLAAAFADAGHRVTVCARSANAPLRLERDGASRALGVPVVDDPSEARHAEWVLLCTKAHQTATVGPWLERTCTPATTVVVCQNGIDHRERLAGLGGPADILPALVYIAAERTALGLVRHRRGRHLVVPADRSGERFAALAPRGVDVRTETDFTTAAWRKLLTNIAANPITALTGQRMAVFGRAQIRHLAVTLLREAVAVGIAEGASLGEEDVSRTLAFYDRFGEEDGTSMLYDRLAGRALEHEPFNGAVTRLGARHGIPTPANQAIYAVLDAIAA